MAYDISSTASFMQAMNSLAQGLDSLEIPDIKIPFNKDNEMSLPLDPILAPFATVKPSPRTQPPDLKSTLRDIGGEEILLTVQSMLSYNEEQLQSLLFDVLGTDHLDLIADIVQHKQQLEQPQDPSAETSSSGILSPHQQAQLLNPQKEKLVPKNHTQKYPHVYKNEDVSQLLAAQGKKFALPQGSVRTSFPAYEELVIPAGARARNKWISDHQLVDIALLDILCRGTFHYKTLNAIQSLVYPVAYETNENMLICAPTGAGKTDVALLTILHTIDDFCSDSVDSEGHVTLDIDYDQFKIIYVAPLKSLAAEIVDKYSQKLQWLGIKVRELTGDMQLTKNEILNTQIIVTTPEKWDIVTRKLNGDSELVSKVKLLIIDEVHLLHEDRGSVIETLVARTLRQVETSQQMIRVIGLSATLPNYMDVADFLGVNRQMGMFYFDHSFRPVPLRQDLIGVRGKSGSKTARENLDVVSYDKLAEYVKQGLQVMVFVHQRRETINTARNYISRAQEYGEMGIFDASECPQYSHFKRDVAGKNRSKDLRDLFPYGFGVHHAGMLRSDRNLVEKMFTAGAIKVLCCTATLAWGVNLPAAVVIIKGTQVYDAKQGGFADLGISDVIQIFGRAGRPQYEQFGTGILCTTSDRLDHYISLITQQHPIESKLAGKLVDNLNAEISLGSVTNVEEGVQWLGYTYMMVRMRKNPFAYGIDWHELQQDPLLYNRRRDMIIAAARRLHKLQMIVFGEEAGTFTAKDLGRIASDFYLLNNSIEVFNQMLSPKATEADVLSIISMSSEFDSVKFREEEKQELAQIAEITPCQVPEKVEPAQSKTNVLLQAFISQIAVKDSALIADCNYVAQNSARIVRALFLVGINRRWSTFLRLVLSLSKSIDKKVWEFDHPLAQFDLPEPILRNIRHKNPLLDSLRDMEPAELGDFVHNTKMGSIVYKLISKIPFVDVSGDSFPISSNVMRVNITLTPQFQWDVKYHGTMELFWVFLEESDSTCVLQVDKFLVSKRQIDHPHQMEFMIPLADPLPPQVVVRVVSDTWFGSETVHPISFQHLIRPTNETIRTNLLRLQPLPVTALHNKEIEAIYTPKFSYFNPMQTMTFFNLYNTGDNVFVGSPTGSGKTVIAELAMWHAFTKGGMKFTNTTSTNTTSTNINSTKTKSQGPRTKVVYIAPMKALVRERVDDWRARIALKTRHKVVELTGDSLPEAKEIRESDIIITTPEKFDGISRNWQTRTFVQQVLLVIMDEIHLLASDRGPILEMIVSRMNYIGSQTGNPIRLLGMSTAVSNAIDMAGWLGVKEGLFNFPLSVRPVPLQMFIDGFPDNLAFSPLMKTMNKPTFQAIKQHSPTKPVLIFVASRRQTRLTALDLIHLCGLEQNPRRFLHADDAELESILLRVQDDTLRLALQFGIGVHHAGLVDSDRRLAHQLFQDGKVQILVATSTLAWGVNLPAYLVIIKGTQFFDAKIEGYRDMDLTDILQMMGRAGRPAYDTSGVAIVFTKAAKKVFYKHFLNLGFPVESSLHKVLADHIGAEISSGTISTRQEALNFLTWTFLYRRAHNNPSYYGITDTSPAGVSTYLAGLIDSTVQSLVESRCVVEKGDDLVATPFLDISSYYYLSHRTIRRVVCGVNNSFSFRDCLKLLCGATEYDELATRHGEELINIEMSRSMKYPAEDMEKEFIWDPHVKAYLLLQAFMSRIELPIADYAQDTIAILDQSLRILQAFIDVAAEMGFVASVLLFIELMQCIKQRIWPEESPILVLPGCEHHQKRPQEGAKKGPDFNALGTASKAKVIKWADTFVDNNDVISNKKYGSSTSPKDQFVYVVTHLPTASLTTSQSSTSSLEVTLTHNNYPLDNIFTSYCPHFPKPQRESWFIIVERRGELMMMKRASPRMSKNKKGIILTILHVPSGLMGEKVNVICVNDAVDVRYEEEVELISQ